MNMNIILLIVIVFLAILLFGKPDNPENFMNMGLYNRDPQYFVKNKLPYICGYEESQGRTPYCYREDEYNEEFDKYVPWESHYRTY